MSNEARTHLHTLQQSVRFMPLDRPCCQSSDGIGKDHQDLELDWASAEASRSDRLLNSGRRSRLAPTRRALEAARRSKMDSETKTERLMSHEPEPPPICVGYDECRRPVYEETEGH